MNQNTEPMKRDKLDILLGILEIASEPVKKTHILYRANINFYQLTRYIDLLTRLEMLEEINQPYKGYRITEKGRKMLDLFKHGELNAADNGKKLLQRKASMESLEQIPTIASISKTDTDGEEMA